MTGQQVSVTDIGFSNGGRYSLLLSQLLVAIAIAAAVLALWYAIPATFGIATDVARNYNEGWMVTHTQRLLLGLPLYPPEDVLVVNNYPPLWYLALAAANAIGFDMNAAGRVIELASFAGCGVFVYLISRQLPASRLAATAAATVFLGIASSWLPGYLGIDDPHLTGLCLMLCGVWVALRNSGTRALVLAAFVCCVAGFVKHSLMPLPLSLSLYFLATDRRAFAIYTGALVAFMSIGLGICTAVWGADFWSGMSSVTTFGRWKLQLHIESHIYFYLSMFAAAIVAVRCWRKNTRCMWLCLYLAISLAFGVLYQSATGTAGNHFYDALVAFSLVFAGAVTAMSAGGKSGSYLMIAAVGTMLIGNAVLSWHKPLDRLAAREERNRAEQQVAAALRSLEGNVACEDAMLCIAADKLSQLDVFNMGQRLARGRLSAEDVFDILHSRGVVAIQFTGVPGSSDRLVAEDVEALLAMYPQQVVANAHFTLQRRRPTAMALEQQGALQVPADGQQ